MTYPCRSLACLGILVLLLAPRVASAAPKVGERFDFQGPSMDGKTVNSKNLAGKMILVEFWATTCSVCVAGAPEMARLNEVYGPEGLQIVGVSLDENKDAPVKFARDAGWNWPQILDKPQRRLARQFDVQGTPSLFLINPDGVLVWQGSPAEGLHEALAEHMKKTPPRLPKEAKPNAPRPPETSAARAKSALSMAAAYRTAGKNDLARQRYEQVVKEFPGTAEAKEAQRELATLPK